MRLRALLLCSTAVLIVAASAPVALAAELPQRVTLVNEQPHGPSKYPQCEKSKSFPTRWFCRFR